MTVSDVEEEPQLGAGDGGPPDPTEDDRLAATTEKWWTWGAVIVLVALLVVTAFVVGRRTGGPPSSDVDVGFLGDMSFHHEQAVEMALIELQRGTDPETLHFAQEVVLFQRWELGKMDAWLHDRGEVAPPPDPDRVAMDWMNAPYPLAKMPGIATDAQMEQLRLADGREADLLFLELMTAHHRGGLPMADYAAGRAADPDIAAMAEVMARNQRGEIAEYERTMDRLRADGPTSTG